MPLGKWLLSICACVLVLHQVKEELEVDVDSAKSWPVLEEAQKEYTDFLEKARRESQQNGNSCLQQLGGLMADLEHACKVLMKMEGNRFLSKKCGESVNSLFLYGKDFLQALKVPLTARPLLKDAYFLKQWMVTLATSKKAAILWAGFWTNASDPEGPKSRASKENLLGFADLIETQTVHPSTELGRMVDKHSDLEACQGPVENFLKDNMWSFLSFSFVYGMRRKNQDVVVALVHKEVNGARPLDESILFQYEVPTIGFAAWGMGFWSPQVVLIDLLGTCNQTSPLLRQQLFSGVRPYRSLAPYIRMEDFVRRSRLSWTCLDCPHSSCHLDQRLADQVKLIIQAKRDQDEKGKALIKAAQRGEVTKVQQLLKNGTDVNFQDIHGNTALFFAVRSDVSRTATTAASLKEGASANARNSQGNTPLQGREGSPGFTEFQDPLAKRSS